MTGIVRTRDLPQALRARLGLPTARRRPASRTRNEPVPLWPTYPVGHVLASFTVPGQPVPKARPRWAPHGGTYTPQRTVEAEQRIQQYLVVAHPGIRPYSGAVGVKIDFFLAGVREQSRSDIDNLIKTVFDAACNGCVITNDVYVDALNVRRYWRQAEPRTEITISVLGES